MKNNSQHPKPKDGEKRKLKKPVICYPNENLENENLEILHKQENT